MNSASSYAFLPYPSTSQVTSPGLQHQNQPQQSQQPQQPQQKQQQQQQQHPLGPVTTQQQQQQQQQPQQPQQSQQSQQQQQQQQQQQDLTQDLSAPPTPLSLHPSLQTSSAGVSVSGSLAASPVSVSNNTLSNASGPTLASHGHPTINTAILTSYGNMLPSPQSSQVPSTPTTATLLPSTPPPHTADLDSILATYANQPELLKLIIASKTEEDRRWAEEARFKMMDLIMRGENRNLITGYEGLLGQVVPGPTAGTPTSTIPTGNMGTSPTTSTVATSTITTSTATIPTTTTTTSSALGLAVSGKRFMDNAFDSHSGAANSGNGSGGSNGFAQGADLALARKRSVTFARDVHHGHLRSQSMSSVPSLSSTGSTITASADQFGTLSMMGLTGPNTALQQQQQHHPHQIPSHPSLNQLAPFTLQQPFQQQHFQQHQSQQSNQMQQVAHQQLPPHFGQYPQPFPYHTMSQFQPQNVIRRTSSLSHLSHFAQNPHATVTEPRLAASRPRNDSASSFRTLDDSDDESDDGYNDHPVLGGMDSRPGSSLSMHNMMGGNGETSLTLDFSDMATVSGNGPYTSQPPQQGSQHNQPGTSSSILSSLHGTGSVVSMGISGLGHGTTVRNVPTSAAGLSGSTTSAAVSAADQKRKRKRREMQPVNKIVESPDPHIDQYLWKNNGNTTQKKTGCKSIYYKCSNSAGGCTVNKTVTEKESGGYITKYRGEHLEDCIKFKRAQMAAQAAQNAYSLQREQ